MARWGSSSRSLSHSAPLPPLHSLLHCRSVYGQVGMYRDDIEDDDFMVIMDSVAAYARSMVRSDGRGIGYQLGLSSG